MMSGGKHSYHPRRVLPTGRLTQRLGQLGRALCLPPRAVWAEEASRGQDDPERPVV